jgi:hypothetical protein
MNSDWEATEQRLVERSAERRGALERRDRRRRWLPWVLCPLVLPALGAAVLLYVLDSAGGDFRGWTGWHVLAVIGACFVVPAGLSAWVARRQGVLEAIAWALACAAVQFALVVGVGLLALGLGPAD